MGVGQRATPAKAAGHGIGKQPRAVYGWRASGCRPFVSWPEKTRKKMMRLLSLTRI